eukprot:920629-Rhodomonas_salina.1
MSTNGGELASWKSDQKLSFAMLQAREAVAEVAEDPRNRKAAKLSRANSIMKALDDVGTLGQPMTSWQKRAAATGGLGATQFNQQFASLPRARVNSRPSSGGSGITRGFSQSSGSIGRSDSDERTSIQRSLRTLCVTSATPNTHPSCPLNVPSHLLSDLTRTHTQSVRGGDARDGAGPAQQAPAKTLPQRFGAPCNEAPQHQVRCLPKPLTSVLARVMPIDSRTGDVL